MLRTLSLLLLAALFVACGGPSGTEVESSAAEETDENVQFTGTYAIDADASEVEWEGTKLVGGGHTGTIAIEDGQLKVNNGELVGGTIKMDVTRLANNDLEGEDRGKLEGHLKSPDFFDVEQYPDATFEITRVTPVSGKDHTHDVTGNLTLKGNSRSITIPANVTMEGNELRAMTEEFVIDRTEWGMQYGSGSITGIAQDNIINDEVGLQFEVVAMQQ